MRLHKYMADCGVASRRKCEALIRSGAVEVDGVVVTEMGILVDTNNVVTCGGVIVTPVARRLYIALNKPLGVISSAKDQFGRVTVTDLVATAAGERVYPVGRLDYDTTGLIFLTNDGAFANSIMHPKHAIQKTYTAVVHGCVSASAVHALEDGVILDHRTTSPAVVELLSVDENSSTLNITISEGRNRQVRRMLDLVGHSVISLRRVDIGGVGVDGLKEGEWRILTDAEVERFR